MRSSSPTDVDLIVNCYERTYRDVLRDGFFHAVEAENSWSFSGRYAVINNVVDRADAETRAQRLVGSGELNGYVFVGDAIGRALKVTGVRRWELGRRAYLLDYGLVFSVMGTASWILIRDAELSLSPPGDWITDALALMGRRADVLSAAPGWPERAFDTLEEETIEIDGPWHLNWGASDQCLLIRRSDLASHMWHALLVPAMWARHERHPFTFEARLEGYQRSHRRYRASLSTVRYCTKDIPTSVVDRDGTSRLERLRIRCLTRLRRSMHHRFTHPRLRLP